MEKNEVCIMETQPGANWPPVRDFFCVPIDDGVGRVEGGDASLYFYFDINFKVPIIGVDTQQGTGGWAGPYTVLLPDFTVDPTSDSMGCTSGMKLRYVNSLTTSLLQMPLEYNLTEDLADYTNFLGPHSVQNMAEIQGTGEGWEENPWGGGGTCEGGDVKPVLPVMEWYKGCKGKDGKETMRVKVSARHAPRRDSSPKKIRQEEG